MKTLSPAAVVALKEALCAVYWYKSDLRSFLQQCLSNPALLSVLNWDYYKRQIVSDLVDQLVAKPDNYIGDLTRLCHEVCKITNFQHLQQLDGGTQKAERANIAVKQLRELLDPHEQAEAERDDLAERQRRATDKLKANAAVRQRLEAIRSRYMALVTSSNPQDRGFELERVMYDLFELFDLDPKASFRNVGEQIDGAFALEGTDYLFEAKWQNRLVDAAALDIFASKVRRKLENTLGVFLSISGYAADGVAAHSAGGAVIILMDGSELMAVLEERVDFVTLLRWKKRHAARTGEIYCQIRQTGLGSP